MESILTRIKKLAKEQKMNLNEVGEKSGLATNAIYKLQSQTPRVDKIEKIANTLNTSVDYLLGRTDDKFALSKKEMIDVGEMTESLLEGLDTDGSVNFYGEPMTDEDKSELRGIIQAAVIMNKKKAKEHRALNKDTKEGD